ncbi:MAG: flavodoxin family protein [Anaerolineae bacterium]|jgi:multimeric flavodoxin WrbA
MYILGIVGSPRKAGRSNELADAALAGASGAGAETAKLYLVDYDIKPFTGQGGSEEGGRFCPAELSDAVARADALIVTAPVYWGDINGLTKDFMDSVRLSHAQGNGLPALGAAVAGGSGKGLLSGVQSIYHWFYHKQMRAIDPTPVSRFNMDEALESMAASGARLAETAAHRTPFSGNTADERWGDVVAWYAGLAYLRDGPAEEFMMLARQLLKEAGEGADPRARALYDRAMAARERGDLAEAGRLSVETYRLLFH